MSGVEQAGELRRELGQRLKAERLKLGMSQRQLAFRIGYTRSAVSNLESASGGYVARVFWERCDQLFGTGRRFAHGYDRIHQAQQQMTAGRRAARKNSWDHATGRRRLSALLRAGNAGAVPHALAAYGELGWPVEQRQERIELVTGTAIDALELPRPAGMLAVHWWRYTGGAADEVRGLPALPHPDEALVVIDAGPSFYFLAQAGCYPWHGADVPADAPPATRAPSVGWHSVGGRVPAPPSTLGNGRMARWAHLPSRSLALPPAVGLLDLLVKAAACLRLGTHALAFSPGVLVIPGRRPPAPSAGGPPGAHGSRRRDDR